MGATGKKLLYVESLRGLAALTVVFTHYAATFFPYATGGPGQPVHSPLDKTFYNTPLNVLINGNFSVCIFFILSGFVLTIAFFRTGRTDILSRSAFKRYLRLALPVTASIVLVYLALALRLDYTRDLAQVTGSGWVKGVWQVVPDAWAALKEATYTTFFPGTNALASYNPVLWTMQTEFIGSFLVFGMAAVLRLFRLRAWVYLALVLLYWHSYFLGFVFGLVLADIVSNEKVWDQVRAIPWPAWLMFIVTGLVLGGYPTSAVTSGTFYANFFLPLGDVNQAVVTWHMLGALLVVGGVLAWPATWKMLEWRPLVILGKQSFGLYLTHTLVIGTLSSYLFTSLIMSSHGYLRSFGLTMAVSVPVLFALSYLFTRWVDQPTIALTQWLVAARSGRTATDDRPALTDAEPAKRPTAPRAAG